MFRASLSRLLAVAVLSVSAALAVPVFIPSDAGIQGQVFIPTGEEANMAAWVFDLRGSAAGTVVEVPPGTDLGTLNLTDDLGGVPPAFGNLTLFLLNSTSTEGLLALFDPANTSVFGDTTWDFTGETIAFTNITDPVLAAFLGVISAQFNLIGSEAIDGGTLVTYGLGFLAGPEQIPGGPEVPEPATVALAGAGLLVVALARRRKNRVQ